MVDKEKLFEWIVSSYKDLMVLLFDVCWCFGYVLLLVQMGDQDDVVKVFKGFGGVGVLEVVEDDVGGMYWVVYMVKFVEVVFVLYCFQKKSKSGIVMFKVDMDIICVWLKVVEVLVQEL